MAKTKLSLNRLAVTKNKYHTTNRIIALFVVIQMMGFLSGCGGGPSDANISDAVKRYCEADGGGALFYGGMLGSIKLPDRPAYAGLFDYGDKLTISDVRVVKSGDSFQEGDSMTCLPVRVYIKGIRVAEYSKMVPGSMGKIIHDKYVNLPFEGETDVVVGFKPSDKTKVDREPGQWTVQRWR